jgi:hypothetical protein
MKEAVKVGSDERGRERGPFHKGLKDWMLSLRSPIQL